MHSAIAATTTTAITAAAAVVPRLVPQRQLLH